MAIKKVWVTDDCIACGLSESTCPEVFEVHNKAQVKENVDFSAYEDKIREAAKNCPVQAIKYE
ncbi:MAG: ferredoxin [Prevotellaceae bacterium]|jgi:ferredoxin|nr:ferredoxin [Prevotellaceae bacterium]